MKVSSVETAEWIQVICWGRRQLKMLLDCNNFPNQFLHTMSILKPCSAKQLSQEQKFFIYSCFGCHDFNLGRPTGRIMSRSWVPYIFILSSVYIFFAVFNFFCPRFSMRHLVRVCGLIQIITEHATCFIFLQASHFRTLNGFNCWRFFNVGSKVLFSVLVIVMPQT